MHPCIPHPLSTHHPSSIAQTSIHSYIHPSNHHPSIHTSITYHPSIHLSPIHLCINISLQCIHVFLIHLSSIHLLKIIYPVQNLSITSIHLSTNHTLIHKCVHHPSTHLLINLSVNHPCIHYSSLSHQHQTKLSVQAHS